MAASDALVECVPNVSEGRDPDVIAALAAAITSVSGVRLLHVDAGADAHRTVFTFVGEPEPAGDAAIALAAAVARLIDMRAQRGAHPRLGALDVCPFVPVRGVSMARCVGLARRVASTIAHDHDVPAFLYEEAAWDRRRAALPTLRRGEYEGLPERLADPEFVPDFGPARRHPSLGAVIVGARPFLIAWNLALDTTDVGVAQAIAARVRASGAMVQEHGARFRRPGRLPAVRAVGWSMPSYGHAQVSLNVLDHTVTPLHVAWQVVGEEARGLGARVIGSELIGLVPLDALRAAGRVALAGARGEPDDAALVAAAVGLLGLDVVRPFAPRERVLEWAIADAG